MMLWVPLAVTLAYTSLWIWVAITCPFADEPRHGNWCEEWRTSCVQQPWNGISNIGFLVTGTIIGRFSRTWEEFWLAIQLFYVLFASTLFHLSGGGAYPYGLMDVGGVVTILLMLMNHLIRVTWTIIRARPIQHFRLWYWTALEALIFFVLGLTFEWQPWLTLLGWKIVFWLYMGLMIQFLCILGFMLTVTLRAFPEVRRPFAGMLITAVLACFGIVWINVNGYDDPVATHCALGDMGHGVVQLLQAYGVFVVWWFQRQCLFLWLPTII